MADRITAHTVARFPAPAEGALTIEADPGAYLGIDVHLLISPPGAATSIATDVGTARLGSVKSIAVPGGIVEVSGTSGALPRIPETNPELRVLFAFDSATGQPTGVGLKYNRARNVIALDRPVTAALAYTPFRAAVQELIYSPLVEGTRTTYGVVAAFRPPSTLVVHQVELPTFAGQNDLELYRIVSFAVSDRTNQYEMPPNFPTSGTFPGKSEPVVDTDSFFRTKRVHEMGFMRPLDGFAYVRQFYVPVLEPYVGDGSYTITKTLEEATLPADLDRALVAKAKNFIASRKLGKL